MNASSKACDVICGAHYGVALRYVAVARVLEASATSAGGGELWRNREALEGVVASGRRGWQWNDGIMMWRGARQALFTILCDRGGSS